MKPERELRPTDVGIILGCSTARARRLMSTGAIRSWVDTTSKDKRRYRVTVESEVVKYQQRRIDQGSLGANPSEMDRPRRVTGRPKGLSLADVFAGT